MCRRGAGSHNWTHVSPPFRARNPLFLGSLLANRTLLPMRRKFDTTLNRMAAGELNAEYAHELTRSMRLPQSPCSSLARRPCIAAVQFRNTPERD